MPTLMWDASGVAKRYAAEIGTATVQALFALRPALRMVCTVIGYGEAVSILQRRFNGGRLDRADYFAARSLLRLELVESTTFELIPCEDHVFLSVPLMERHNINATDAAILAAYLDFRQTLPPSELPCVLVASDHRLLRAAAAEGLTTLDPEAVAVDDVTAYLESL